MKEIESSTDFARNRHSLFSSLSLLFSSRRMVSLHVIELGNIHGFSTGLDGPTPDLPAQSKEYREPPSF